MGYGVRCPAIKKMTDDVWVVFAGQKTFPYSLAHVVVGGANPREKKKKKWKTIDQKQLFKLLNRFGDCQKNYKRFSCSSQFLVCFFFSLVINWHEWKWMKRCQEKRKQRRHEKFRFQSKNVDVTPIAQKMLSPWRIPRLLQAKSCVNNFFFWMWLLRYRCDQLIRVKDKN